MNIENYGNGKNITLQTLDAILCHNGEIVEGIYKPCKKSKQEFLKEYESTYKDKDACKKLSPMTLEGCVVRISDLIAYLGRDIDDAIRMNLLKWEDVPENITKVLGSNTNEERKLLKTMINTLFDTYMEDLKTNNKESNIIKSYLSNMSDDYKKNTNERIVIDYIAGMTDDYTLKEYNKILKTKHNNIEVQNEI